MWKRILLNNAREIFEDKRRKRRKDKEIQIDELYPQFN